MAQFEVTVTREWRARVWYTGTAIIEADSKEEAEEKSALQETADQVIWDELAPDDIDLTNLIEESVEVTAR